jgi:hypothetical protein
MLPTETQGGGTQGVLQIEIRQREVGLCQHNHACPDQYIYPYANTLYLSTCVCMFTYIDLDTHMFRYTRALFHAFVCVKNGLAYISVLNFMYICYLLCEDT